MLGCSSLLPFLDAWWTCSCEWGPQCGVGCCQNSPDGDALSQLERCWTNQIDALGFECFIPGIVCLRKNSPKYNGDLLETKTNCMTFHHEASTAPHELILKRCFVANHHNTNHRCSCRSDRSLPAACLRRNQLRTRETVFCTRRSQFKKKQPTPFALTIHVFKISRRINHAAEIIRRT